MTVIFPNKDDYPDAFSILDNPKKNTELYMRLVVSSASAYFETDIITRHFFKKRFYLVDEYLTKNPPCSAPNGNDIGRARSNVKCTALDVGCGIGFLLPTLASHAEKVVGLDYSPDVLSYAKYMAEKRGMTSASFVEGSIMELPFADNSFDLVVCMSVLEHFEQPEGPLAELKRVTAPQGVLIVGYPTETPLFHFLHNTASRIIPKRRKIEKIFEKEQPGEEFHAPHVATAKTIQRAIHTVGLQEQERQSIKLLPPFLELYRINFLRK